MLLSAYINYDTMVGINNNVPVRMVFLLSRTRTRQHGTHAHSNSENKKLTRQKPWLPIQNKASSAHIGTMIKTHHYPVHTDTKAE
jgi:hypothetical protein